MMTMKKRIILTDLSCTKRESQISKKYSIFLKEKKIPIKEKIEFNKKNNYF